MLKYVFGASANGGNLSTQEKLVVGAGGASVFSTNTSSIGASGISQSQGQGWQVGNVVGHSTTDSSYTNAHGTGSSHTESTNFMGQKTTTTDFTNINASGLHTGETMNDREVYGVDVTADGVDLSCCGSGVNLCSPCCYLISCLPSIGNCNLNCCEGVDLSCLCDCLSGALSLCGGND